MKLRLGTLALALCLSAPLIGFAIMAVLTRGMQRPGLTVFFYTLVIWFLVDLVAIALGGLGWRGPSRVDRGCARAAVVLGALVLVVPVYVLVGFVLTVVTL